MKGKIKLLSIISALVMGVTMTFTACGKSDVAEHDHVWDNGVVTKESTCYLEGIKTYTCTVEGCGQTKTEPVAMTAHTWNGGEVTKAATCKEEGVKTYTCTVEGCGKTKEEAVEKTAHKWNDGEITKIPDFLTKGEKTYACLDCNEKKTESVEARADFAEQYISTVGVSNWLYGYTESFNADTNEAELITIDSPTDGVWKAEGVVIGHGYIYSQKHVIIGYSFSEEVPEQVQAELSISFKGEESTTVLKAYLLVTDGEGEVKGREALNAECKKDWNYATEEAVDIAQGYNFWLVFENAGTGKAGGNLTFTLKAPCVHVWNSTGSVKEPATCKEEGVMEYSCINCDVKREETIDKVPHEYESKITQEPTEKQDGVRTYTCVNCGDSYTESIPKLGTEMEIANFEKDFELTESGEFAGWTVGKVDYDWPNENFSFTKITAKNSGGDAYNNHDPWMEIKGDWMAVNGMMGFAYHFSGSGEVTFNFELTNSENRGDFAVRWALKDSSGNITTNGGKASWGGEGHDIKVTSDITVKTGYVLYILVEKKDGSDTDQCRFSLVLTAEEELEQPAPEFKGADFRDDFYTDLEDKNSWLYGYSDYTWDGGESFEFHQFEKYVEDGAYAWKSDKEGSAQIKNDWIDVGWGECGNATIAYHTEQVITFNLRLHFNGGTDNTRVIVRIGIKDKDGNLKRTPEGIWDGASVKEWTLNKEFTLQAGDTIYIIFFDEHKDLFEGWPNGNIEIKLEAEGQTQQPENPFEGADFHDDFYRDLEDKNSWLYGYSDYTWDGGESFEFHQFENYVEDGAYAWKSDKEGSAQIKDDWIDVGWGECSNATIAYCADKAVTFNLKIHFTGGMPNTRVIVRIGVKDKDGNLKGVPTGYWDGANNKEWSIDVQFTLEEGDTIYIIFFDEHKDLPEGWANGNVDITLTSVKNED